MRIEDARHAFVTGGASGIGLAIADALVERGVAVTIADIDEATMAGVLAERGEQYRGVALDVRDREGWEQARAEAEAAFGPVDILANNAGIAAGGTQLADMDPEDFDRTIAINLTGVFNGVRNFASGMRERGRGHIVNTSSMQGMFADGPGIGNYGTAKAGVVALSEVLRIEMEPHGVGVSAFCPGMTMTPMVARALGTDKLDELPPALTVVPMTADRVADIVLRGIEQNRAYIFTHPARKAGVERRYEAIMADYAITEREAEEWEA